MRVGFAGAGNMAAAIARGWHGVDGGPEAMLFSDLDSARAEALAEEVDGETRGSLRDLASDCDVIVLAVKPAALAEVAEELGGSAPALISLLAATPLARLAEAFPGVPAIRLMPNQPVQVREGVVCYAVGEDVPGELRERLVALLEPLGTLIALNEDLMDPAMAVMSCSPAYVALFAEALADAGVAEGLDAELSARLVTDTFAGTAALLRVRDPEAVRRAVAPPGGATEAGLEALERGEIRSTIASAVTASLERFR
jgi:pyrroline-5-carboxylate reductase